MKKPISSRWTFPNKFIGPIVWLGFFAWLSHAFIAEGDWILLVILLTVLGPVTAYFLWCSLVIKRIQRDETMIYVSNYFRSEAISLSDIQTVMHKRWTADHPATIVLSRPSGFGSTLHFMAPRFLRQDLELWTTLWFKRPANPVVEELRRIAEDNGKLENVSDARS